MNNKKECSHEEKSGATEKILWKKGESKYSWNKEGNFKCYRSTCSNCGKRYEFIKI